MSKFPAGPEYLESLAKDLILKHKYEREYQIVHDKELFFAYVRVDLLLSEVSVMTPQVLGKIVCSASFPSLEVLFKGEIEGEALLRDISAAILAEIVCDILSSANLPSTESDSR